MEKAIRVVKELGFPIAVSILLLYFCFVSISRNTQAIQLLDKSITQLTLTVQELRTSLR
jgi:hypothetical protein